MMEQAWKAEAKAVLRPGSAPMLGGLGRDLRVRAALELLPLAERRELLAALDEVTRPMTGREVEDALLATGLSRGDRRRLKNALSGFRVLLVARDD